MPGFFVENFGCRATQADGASLERQFEERGLFRAANAAQASLVVLNTCTVTDERRPGCTGGDTSRAPARIPTPGSSSLDVTRNVRRKRSHPCPASTSSSEISTNISWRKSPCLMIWRSPTAGAFVPLSSLTPDHQRPSAEDQRPIFVSDIFAHTELLAAPVFDAANERTRPNLKVQDGCDNRCSFCVIPYVRGQSRSLPMERIIREVNALVDSAYREVVISGINLGRWGRDLPADVATAAPGCRAERSSPSSLTALVRAILRETNLEKLRISSVEPMDWSDDFIELMASSPRIAKHAHVPMQSGSDTVLRRMHRKYRPWHYREKIEKIRKAMPDAAIGADVMVGFPGETEREFEETRCMVEELPFTYLHVFTYSARPGTPAANMPGQVPVHVARQRNRVLRELAAEKKLAFMRGFVGKTLEAITLNVVGTDTVGEFTEALTDNYLKLRLRGVHDANAWVRASVQGVIHGNLSGEAVDQSVTALLMSS